MNQNNLDLLPEDIREEFSVEPDGKIYASRRATARLSGMKSDHPINNLLNNILHQKNLSKPLQPFAGQSFKTAPKLPDTLVGAIIIHYALKGREQAIDCMTAFNNIGIRTWFQQQLGWQPEKPPEKPLSLAEMFARQAQINLEYEQRLKSQEEALKVQDQVQNAQLQLSIEHTEVQLAHTKAIYGLADQLEQVTDSCMYLMEERIKRSSILHGAVLSNDEVTPLTRRKIVWDLVNRYCYIFDTDQQDAWSYFYKQLKLREGFDAIARAKNQGVKPIDVVEQNPRMLEKLHAIVSDELRKVDTSQAELIEQYEKLRSAVEIPEVDS